MLQVEVYDVSCPANTGANNAIEIGQIGDPSSQVSSVIIRIPAGHAGLTGIALAYGHQPVIPRNTGAFLSGDDDTFSFDLTDYPAGVPWSVFVCNLDILSHVWQVTWEMETADTTVQPAAAVILPPSVIVAAGS